MIYPCRRDRIYILSPTTFTLETMCKKLRVETKSTTAQFGNNDRTTYGYRTGIDTLINLTSSCFFLYFLQDHIIPICLPFLVGVGTGTGAGTGAGNEIGSGIGTGKGRGRGTGSGSGRGIGSGIGIGTGKGTGTGNGTGTGRGCLVDLLPFLSIVINPILPFPFPLGSRVSRVDGEDEGTGVGTGAAEGCLVDFLLVLSIAIPPFPLVGRGVFVGSRVVTENVGASEGAGDGTLDDFPFPLIFIPAAAF
jgi:hypothetical protein